VSFIAFQDSKNAWIFFNSIFSGVKVNVVFTSGVQMQKIPCGFQQSQEKQTKIKEKL